MGRALSGNARARRAILIASVGGFFGFYLELSVFPVLAARDHGSVAAGVLTFATMVATVCTQFVTPRLVHHVAPRSLLATGILLATGPGVWVVYVAVESRRRPDRRVPVPLSVFRPVAVSTAKGDDQLL